MDMGLGRVQKGRKLTIAVVHLLFFYFYFFIFGKVPAPGAASFPGVSDPYIKNIYVFSCPDHILPYFLVI